MALKGNYEFLFVGKDDNSFLENYYYDLFQEHGDKSGQIFVNLEIQNNLVDAEEIGRVLFETMQKVFFEDVGKDPYDRFEISLKAVNSVLNQFKNQKNSGYIGNLNVVIAAVVGDNLFLTQTGDSEAYLIRKRYVSIISEGLSEEEIEAGEIFTNIASGKIEPGDFVLFSSTRLLRYISKTDLVKCVQKHVIAEVLNEVKEIITTEMLGRIGLTGILFETAKKEDIEGIGEEVDTATRSLLESTQSQTSAQKESITGKFLTAFKGRKSAELFRGTSSWKSMGSSFVNFWKNLFTGGFGKNKILYLLILVIVVLGIGIFYARSSMQTRAEIQKLDAVLTGVQEKLAEADTKGSYDKPLAKTILDQAYADAMSVLNSGYYRDKAVLFLGQIEEERDKLDNVKRVDNPVIAADLSQKRSDVNALGFASVSGRIFVYEYNALYELVLDQIQAPLTVDATETVIAATGFEDRNSIVFLTESGKLIEYRNGAMSFMDTDDGTFHKGVSIRDWANRIYLLDPTGNQIWRYTYKGTQERFGAAEPYLVANQQVDLSTAVNFAIDANLFVLMKNGDLFKFYAGKKAEFFINNAPFNAFRQPTVVYTNDKLDQVFMLDVSDSRVLAFNKDAKTGNIEYTSQYLFSNVGELRDLYVDAQSRKLYVLTQSKVLETDL